MFFGECTKPWDDVVQLRCCCDNVDIVVSCGAECNLRSCCRVNECVGKSGLRVLREETGAVRLSVQVNDQYGLALEGELLRDVDCRGCLSNPAFVVVER